MLFYGLDVGTTNTKAVLLDCDGSILDRTNIPSRRQADRSNEAAVWQEQFSQALEYCASKGHLAGEEVVCSVTAQGGSFMMLNANFEALRTCHWTELAGDNTVNDLTGVLDERTYYHITGWQPHGWLPAFKLREHISSGRLPKDARFFATVPDFLYSQMTRRVIVDITNAQITGMCDFDRAQWNDDILNWIAVDRDMLPSIAKTSAVLFDRISTPRGKMSFVTGSHDQYAAMRAAGLKKGKDVMLGTGTVWVINRRTAKPVFDDSRFVIHPGRDLSEDCFGSIIVIGNIGKGFDELLNRLDVDKASLAEIEAGFAGEDVPKKTVSVDIEQGTVDSECDVPLAIRRYMEYAASRVEFTLEKFLLKKGLRQLVMSGGSSVSRFWPQVIADTCNVAVKAFDFPEYAAYGAALCARDAVTGRAHTGEPARGIESRLYEPQSAPEYQDWYRTHQRGMLEKRFAAEQI